MCHLATSLDFSFGKDNLLKGELWDFKAEMDFRGSETKFPKDVQ